MIRTPVVLTPIPSPSGQVLTPCPPLPSGEGELTTSPIRRNGEEERGTAIPTPGVVATLRCGSDYLGDLLRTSNRYDRVMDPLRHVTSARRFALARQLRRAATPAERHAWSLLRNRGVLGLKFRRQHVLHGFIVDFYCVAERLVVELEGDAHDGSDRQSYDAARAQLLKAAGYRVVRIRNRDVSRQGMEALLRQALGKSAIVPPLLKGEGVRG